MFEFIDKDMREFLDIFLEPFTVDRAIEMYRKLHSVFGLSYVDDMSYITYIRDEDLLNHVKNPEHLTVYIYIKEFKSMMESAIARATDEQTPIVEANIIPKIQAMVDLMGMTMFACLDGTLTRSDGKMDIYTASLSGTNICEKDRCLLSLLEDEVNTIVTLVTSLMDALYTDKDVYNSFSETLGLWNHGLAKILVRSISIKNS